MWPFDVAPCKAAWISWSSQRWLLSGWMKQSCWSPSSRSRFPYDLFSSSLVPVSPVWTTMRLDVLSPPSCLTRYMMTFLISVLQMNQVTERKKTHLKVLLMYYFKWGHTVRESCGFRSQPGPLCMFSLEVIPTLLTKNIRGELDTKILAWMLAIFKITLFLCIYFWVHSHFVCLSNVLLDPCITVVFVFCVLNILIPFFPVVELTM